MLHLTDALTGRSRPAPPSGTRRLRVAYCPASLRAALTADMVRRAAERHHLVVELVRHDCGRAQVPNLMRFNIHPANGTEQPDDPAADIHVTHDADRTDGTGPAPAIVLVVSDDPAPGTPESAAWQAADPLALRLALLGRRPADTDPLSADELAGAAVRLARLRADVARLAENASAAPPAARIAEVHAAVDDDLDTPRALILTDALGADPELPPGSRFEALIHLDRTFGLDLAQDIGR